MVKKLSVHITIAIGLLISVLLPLVLSTLLSTSVLTQLFVFLLGIHTLTCIYFVYTAYELNFLHEKQGSKLTLSKEKLDIP